MLNVLLLLAGVADVSWAAVRDPAASWSTVTSVNESQSVSTPASTLTRSEFMKIIMRGASKYNGGKSAKAMQKARHRARRRRLLLLEQGAMCEADRPLCGSGLECHCADGRRLFGAPEESSPHCTCRAASSPPTGPPPRVPPPLAPPPSAPPPACLPSQSDVNLALNQAAAMSSDAGYGGVQACGVLRPP